jgi:hypothetical protein
VELAVQALSQECERQEESCLYTSTAFFEWIKVLRLWRVAFISLPLICSAVATSALFKHCAWVTGIAILCAGVIPAIFKSLDLDKDIAAMTRYANTFKSLQDRFRQARNIAALGDSDEFKKEFFSLRTKLDDARMASVPIPERYFKKARRKIEHGHYKFQADAPSGKQQIKRARAFGG